MSHTLVKDAAAGFPEEFGLRAFPGEVFRVNEEASYWQDLTNGRTVVQLVVDIRKGERWLNFSKGQPGELRAEMVKL